MYILCLLYFAIACNLWKRIKVNFKWNMFYSNWLSFYAFFIIWHFNSSTSYFILSNFSIMYSCIERPLQTEHYVFILLFYFWFFNLLLLHNHYGNYLFWNFYQFGIFPSDFPLSWSIFGTIIEKFAFLLLI